MNNRTKFLIVALNDTPLIFLPNDATSCRQVSRMHIILHLDVKIVRSVLRLQLIHCTHRSRGIPVQS